ncbi:hypothetical protein [Salinicoccus albus]|uniref:hypothetical protein n=1 Tax=Salinicoccus albus TaxID=418756 RepID=UPI00036B944D|nr:hypothetical protein [Salinicoccus albus]
MIASQERQWLDLVKEQPIAFGIESGFEDLKPIHNEWIKSFLLSRDDLTLQAHRGSYKTTCLSIAMALMTVIYPKENIIFLRKADDDVKEILTQTAKLLQSEIYQSLSLVLYNQPVILEKESAYEIDTNLKATSRGTAQLIGVGSKASLTGKHADIVITDDIINIDDRISKAHRERTKYTYQELQNIKNRGGRFINTGTPWHKEDAFTLMPNVQQYDCYSTGLITDDELQQIRGSMSPSLFAANYELKHIADVDSMFTSPIIDDGTNTDKIYDGAAHIDASYGGEDGTAFTVLKEHDDGHIYVYGDLRSSHIDDVLDIFEHKRMQYRAGTLFTETNADKGYLSKKIKRPAKTYHEKMNKYIKISTYLRENWDRIIFINDTNREYINQILDYTENAEHDDAPDSLASLLRETSKKTQLKLFQHGL